MKNKKMSIRILFPLIMSVSIAFCIISCMILFSHYLSAYFIQKTVEDTNKQKNVLAQNIENEIESINDTINTIYYDTIKKYDLQDEAYIMHNKVVSSKRGSGIGVRNVDERIKLIFGNAYGVVITSELDEGTTASIIIPKIKKVEDIGY